MRQHLNLTALKRESLNFVHFVAASAPTYKYASAALFAGFLLGLIGPTYELMVMRISDVFSFHLWRIFTNIFVEPNVFLFAWSLLAVHQFFTYILPVWGLPEIIKFVAVTQMLTTMLISVLGLLLFACFQALNLFYYAPVCGFSIASVSAMVSLKQYLPDTVVLTTPYGRLKNGHLPLTSLFFTSVFWLLGLVRSTAPIQVLLGLQISWTYLRFFQSLPGSDHVGDDSEHFTWTSLFPRRIQPFTSFIAKAVFPVLVGLRLCKKLQDIDALNAFETLQSSFPEGRDAERKRQKALRVLNERLNLSVTVQDKRMQVSDSIPSPPISELPNLNQEVKIDELINVNVINSPEKQPA